MISSVKTLGRSDRGLLHVETDGVAFDMPPIASPASAAGAIWASTVSQPSQDPLLLEQIQSLRNKVNDLTLLTNDLLERIMRMESQDRGTRVSQIYEWITVEDAPLYQV